MNTTLVQIVWTVIAFVSFVGIVIWAWSGRRKEDFDKAARMALDDDKPIDSCDTK
jgi:cytochrome c oxidase cbb3-type subunit 4